MSAIKQGEAKPGDFNFLEGHWKIHNRKRKQVWDINSEWEEFAGESTCWTAMGGLASIEELRIPVGQYRGMGIRILDTAKKHWCDYWASYSTGVLYTPALTGVFENGAGVFIGDDEYEGVAIKCKGVWDNITLDACEWHQAYSRDGGSTWIDNWHMRWTRK